MMIDLKDRAKVLSEALPYILKYRDKIVVVKYGGNAMINEELKELVMQDIVMLHSVGIKVVLAHGGGPEISAMLKKINHESKFVNGVEIIGVCSSHKGNESDEGLTYTNKYDE